MKVIKRTAAEKEAAKRKAAEQTAKDLILAAKKPLGRMGDVLREFKELQRMKNWR